MSKHITAFATAHVRLLAVIGLLSAGALLAGCSSAISTADRQSSPAPTTIRVAAASSLQPAFDEIGPAFEASRGIKVTFVYSSSGRIAIQIRNRAPYDVFASADERYIDELTQDELLRKDAITQYARGGLVLVSPDGTPTLTSPAELTKPGIRRIAIANPEIAPYGLAAKDLLEKAGLWAALRAKLVYGDSVSQALQYVRTGNADAGLVALSLTRGAKLNVAPLDPKDYRPLRQTAGVVADSPSEQEARAFVSYLAEPAVQDILSSFGYLPPED